MSEPQNKAKAETKTAAPASNPLGSMTGFMLMNTDPAKIIQLADAFGLKFNFGDNAKMITMQLVGALSEEDQGKIAPLAMMSGDGPIDPTMLMMMGGKTAGAPAGMDPMMFMMMNQNGGKIDPMLFMMMNQKKNPDGTPAAGGIDPMMLMMMNQGTGEDGEKKPMNPMMLQMLMQKNGGKIDPMTMMLMGGGKIDPMMMMLMNQNKTGGGAGGIDPMMLMMMNKGGAGGKMDPMVMMMLMNQNKGNAGGARPSTNI